MASYLLEGYSRAGPDDLTEALARLRAAARQLIGEGFPLRLGSAIVVPRDETWFHVVEAASVDAVEVLIRRAGLRSVQVAEAFELPPRRARWTTTARRSAPHGSTRRSAPHGSTRPSM